MSLIYTLVGKEGDRVGDEACMSSDFHLATGDSTVRLLPSV